MQDEDKEGVLITLSIIVALILIDVILYTIWRSNGAT